MLTANSQLFATLDQFGIPHSTVEHPAFFTVEDGRDWHDKILGLHGKNLFLKDKKDRLYLVSMPGDKRADITAIEKRIGSARLSFGKPELLLEVLGVTPGSVTPFALINDTARRVQPVLDRDLMAADAVNFHPLVNTASTTVKSQDLQRFMESLGYKPLIVDCG
jgi:Ala-tRNA(Pro) deacylase